MPCFYFAEQKKVSTASTRWHCTTKHKWSGNDQRCWELSAPAACGSEGVASPPSFKHRIQFQAFLSANRYRAEASLSKSMDLQGSALWLISYFTLNKRPHFSSFLDQMAHTFALFTERQTMFIWANLWGSNSWHFWMEKAEVSACQFVQMCCIILPPRGNDSKTGTDCFLV